MSRRAASKAGIRRMPVAVASIALSLACTGAISQAGPFVPDNDEVVLERLPEKSGTLWREVSRLREEVTAGGPADVGSRSRLARGYLELHRETADPRLLGYAEAALAPWGTAPTSPPTVLLLQARILQTRHEFAPAVDLLHTVVARDPRHADAWFQLANIAMVQGNFVEARKSCARLLLIDADLAGVCLAAVNGLTGGAAAALESVTANLSESTASDSTLLWMRTLAGELAAGLGRYADAERHYRAAIEGSAARERPADLYLLTAYADLLLEQKRDADVVALLERSTSADGALLRLARAERRLGLPAADAHAAELVSRFDALLARGDRSHSRELAYLQLYVLGDADRALTLARDNWSKQREIIDARLLLEAAELAGDEASLERVRAWRRDNRVEHVWLGAAPDKKPS